VRFPAIRPAFRPKLQLLPEGPHARPPSGVACNVGLRILDSSNSSNTLNTNVQNIQKVEPKSIAESTLRQSSRRTRNLSIAHNLELETLNSAVTRSSRRPNRSSDAPKPFYESPWPGKGRLALRTEKLRAPILLSELAAWPLPKWVVFEVVRLPYLKTSVTPMGLSSLPAPFRAAVFSRSAFLPFQGFCWFGLESFGEPVWSRYAARQEGCT
jgi:hypothetical protein